MSMNKTASRLHGEKQGGGEGGGGVEEIKTNLKKNQQNTR